MHDFSVILRACPLFARIRPEDLEAMFACLGARNISVRRGDAIFCEGDAAREIGILLCGEAQVIRTDYFGSRSIMMQIRPGDLFGEAFACAGVEALPVSVIAAEDSEAMLIDCQRLMTSCSNACSFHSTLIFNLLKIVANKNLALHQKAAITSRKTTREKLMAYLLEQAKRAGSACFTIPFDRQELADYLEVDRSGLSAEIGKMAKEGLIECRRSEFHLLCAPEEG